MRQHETGLLWTLPQGIARSMFLEKSHLTPSPPTTKTKSKRNINKDMGGGAVWCKIRGVDPES